MEIHWRPDRSAWNAHREKLDWTLNESMPNDLLNINTLVSAYKKFGYYEHSPTTSSFLCINLLFLNGGSVNVDKACLTWCRASGFPGRSMLSCRRPSAPCARQSSSVQSSRKGSAPTRYLSRRLQWKYIRHLQYHMWNFTISQCIEVYEGSRTPVKWSLLLAIKF